MNWQKSFQRGVLLLLVGGAVVACSDDNNNNNNSPTEPQEPVPVITETFNGEIGRLEAQCHFFTLNNVGDVTLQLTEVAPLSSITLGLALGTPAAEDPSQCVDFASDSSVRLLETLTSASLAAGPYCSCVGDVGNIFEDKTVTYALAVTHP